MSGRHLLPVLLTALTCASISPLWADSPVTSTPFADAYLDYPMVVTARNSGVMTPEIASFLASRTRPLDVRAAVINALSWSVDGKQNAELYCRMRHQCSVAELSPEALRGDELMVVGYLLLMDDYHHPGRALPYLEQARGRLPTSYTVAMLHALCLAQADLTGSQPWDLVSRVLDDRSLNGDMRIGAMRIIVDYMSLYREEG